MSEENKQIDYMGRGIKFLTPANHLHLAGGKIDKYEQFIISVHLAAANALEKIEDDINTHPEKVDLHIVRSVKDMALSYVDASGSLDGFRSKQITKWGGSSRSNVPIDGEEGRGWKIWKKKKEDVAGEG